MRIFLFLTILLFSTPSLANCLPPKEMTKALNAQGLFVYAYGSTDFHYLLKIYIGGGVYLITVEDQDISCVVTSGQTLYVTRSHDI